MIDNSKNAIISGYGRSKKMESSNFEIARLISHGNFNGKERRYSHCESGFDGAIVRQ